ncbi:glutamine synthetase III family protein [Ruminococcus sp.]|jgi:glutamine synthetase|uniref:glutamine synthetase III family protein n=1 Tax=Ruminococcus sp. TaxID=41978 RepID=UPI00261855B7|nr:glutamine synthetase III [Ruminococcus sp.]MEE0023175.1 glutamine synthetase III [Ruminococcus sp.]
MSKNVADFFACDVFNDEVMKARLPKPVYKAMTKTRKMGTPLDPTYADVVANAIKDWAIEHGATHYTHWFQPMTGSTAEKHDSFISPTDNGMVIMNFSGKELVKGEPDASSFPSGGLRETCSARGYTAWDPTSYCFVKEGSLYIPTVFVSYTGEALDKKTPLLRSMDALSQQAVRILRLFGNTTATKVTSTVGPEQEYFLIDKKMYDQREDLIMTGRTLFGAMPPKGQELDDQYFANLKPRVAAYMADLDEALWKVGVFATTKHNEVAPAQHEMAPVFSTTNISTDQNELAMEVMEKVALKHGLVCLLHEKPFAGVNGSGKHNNWSMATNDGQNLLDPGSTPMENMQFLTFLCAIIKGIDEYADLLRISASSAGNDHRLGANEAPPAIISIFMGEELQSVLDALEAGTSYKSESKVFEIGVDALPDFPKDSTDRNRTSPFAFTGNRFEFRMVGSSDNIGCPNSLLNAIVAGELSDIADKMEGVSADKFDDTLKSLLVSIIKDHKRVIFNGNGYSDEWVVEAEKRGLPNFKSTVDCVPHYADPKNIALLEKFGVLSEKEIKARMEVLLENYAKTINIEALTMIDMAKKKYIPTCIAYTKELCDAVAVKKSLEICPCVEKELAEKVSGLTKDAYTATNKLEEVVATAAAKDSCVLDMAKSYREDVIPVMDALRSAVDSLEVILPSCKWPVPAYSDIIFNV